MSKSSGSSSSSSSSSSTLKRTIKSHTKHNLSLLSYSLLTNGIEDEQKPALITGLNAVIDHINEGLESKGKPTIGALAGTENLTAIEKKIKEVLQLKYRKVVGKEEDKRTAHMIAERLADYFDTTAIDSVVANKKIGVGIQSAKVDDYITAAAGTEVEALKIIRLKSALEILDIETLKKKIVSKDGITDEAKGQLLNLLDTNASLKPQRDAVVGIELKTLQSKLIKASLPAAQHVYIEKALKTNSADDVKEAIADCKNLNSLVKGRLLKFVDTKAAAAGREAVD